ncbi:DEAD/DEAH box helicase [Paenibacillus sediminis]|uniref:Superfamily II DNA/RNA helicase n=1 Tax=Paenibacillus sediminis TaxID=664909 RepID=A0ABS4H5T2_9BACL|nr:DEAD/DEAH box helicase [Paenibacillus sediminis]MBP1937893.1 superfamily II DNA/RNA helicase [Paenibacillus sediminis]
MNVTSFEGLGIAQDLSAKLLEYGIKTPTPVQVESIPAVLEGRDLLAQSQTGTGKTIAYLLPILQKIDPNLKQTQALILAPTQELAMQIAREGEKYGSDRQIKVLGLIGGASIKRQLEKLKQHPQLIVGTPGRIQEFIAIRKLKMPNIKTIVIDEVDQVFELGGSKDVESILRSSLRDRQLVFLSATINPEIRKLAEQEMKNPVEVGIEPEQRISSTIEHFYFISEERDKMDMLRRIIRTYGSSKAIVFVNNTNDIAEVEAKMNYVGLDAKAIYADADKITRSLVLRQFREGKIRLLVASDVAARGLDIEGLDFVINFDPPIDAEHYVHRAGRTGRMGRKGTAITLITPRQQFIMKKFGKELGVSFEERKLYGGKVIAADSSKDRASRAVASASKVRKPAAQKPAADRKNDRHRDRKNKGAPKWLKNKPPKA